MTENFDSILLVDIVCVCVFVCERIWCRPNKIMTILTDTSLDSRRMRQITTINDDETSHDTPGNLLSILLVQKTKVVTRLRPLQDRSLSLSLSAHLNEMRCKMIDPLICKSSPGPQFHCKVA
jgi:hypothetical protein